MSILSPIGSEIKYDTHSVRSYAQLLLLFAMRVYVACAMGPPDILSLQVRVLLLVRACVSAVPLRNVVIRFI